MLERPVVRPDTCVVDAGAEGVCLIREDGIRVYADRCLARVLASVGDGNEARDVVDAVADEISTARAYFALMHLEQKGELVEAGAFNATAVDRLILHMREPMRCRRVLDEMVVLVDDFSVLEGAGDHLRSSLIEAGLAVLPDDTSAQSGSSTVRVALVDDYLDDSLAGYSSHREKNGEPWLLAKASGMSAWVGPAFSGTAAICWSCLAARLRTNRAAETLLKRRMEYTSPPPVALNSVAAVAHSLIVRQLVRFASEPACDDLGRTIQEYSMHEGSIVQHNVVGLDTCHRCGGQVDCGPEVSLESRTKLFADDGGYRTVDLEQTLRLERRLVSPLTGIVSKLIELPTPEPGLSVFVARHNYGFAPKALLTQPGNLANTSAGKGRSAAQARASALAEAVERHSVFMQGYETVVTGTHDDLADCAIDPNDCMLYSESQYANRESWNASSPWALWVPMRFQPDAEVDWTPVWSLTEERARLLPTAYLYHSPHHAVGPMGSEFCFSDSNGNAAGNNMEEAVLQGLLELVERDAVSIWWYNCLNAPRIDLDSLHDGYVTSLVRAYGRLGREVWVLDIRHDLGIPVYAALSRRIDGVNEEILTGFGAHLKPALAISRALTELNQMLPRASATGADRRRLDSETLAWFSEVSTTTAPFLLGCESGPKEPMTVTGPNTDDLRDDILFCKSRVEELGLELLVHNLSRRETGLSTVKVIAPGMRHYWRRLAPGRLYGVPVATARLATPVNESDVNPYELLG